MRVLVGTSGFSYPAWKGTFYPPGLPAGRMLAFYAARFATVEANGTFYRMPRPEALASWRAQVPDGFVFSLKAPQRITHVQRLRGSEESLSRFGQAAAELGPTLGVVLYQLPPGQKKDLPRLTDFLLQLPRGHAAFEFRHASWFEDDVYAALAGRGTALCVADTDEGTTPIVATSEVGYLRLRRTHYDEKALAGWAERILEQPWREALCYFKHEDEARGPAFALGLLRALGQGAQQEPSVRPQ